MKGLMYAAALIVLIISVAFIGRVQTANAQSKAQKGIGGKLNGTPTYCVPAAVGMVSWYQAENDAKDVRSRIDGTLQGGTAFGTGKIGQAFNFDGIDDYVDLGPGISTQDFSLSMWVKPGATQVQYADIADNNHTSSLNWVIQQDSTNTNVYAFSGAPNFTLAPDAWQHLVVTHDSAFNSKVYVNGILVASGAAAINYDGSQFLRLGRWGNRFGLPNNRNWNGQMDEVAIFDRALSVAEVQSIYSADVSGICKPTATTAPSGIVGWWSGDGDAFDVSGSSGHATLNNGTGFTVGKVGQAFKFDGVDDSISIPATTRLNVGVGGGFTLEAWVKPTTLAEQPLFEWNNGGPNLGDLGSHFWMSSGVTGGLYANILDTSSADHVIASSAVMTAGVYQHIALTYDKPSGIAVIYRNGSITATQNLGSFDPRTSFDLYLGNRPGSLRFAGEMDEASLYDRALTQREIESIYSAGLAGKLKSATTITTTDLVSVWRGEDNANDSFGSNNGTLSGGSYTDGYLGRAISVNGSGGSVSVPDAPNLNFASNAPMTIEMWLYRTSGASPQHIIGKRPGCDGTPFNYQLGWATSDQFFFGAGFGNELIVSGTLPLNTWTHVAGTFDGSTYRLYKNGVLLGSTPGTLGPNVSQPLQIGNSGTCQSFGGLLDEVAMYSRALSAIEISAQFRATSANRTHVGDATIGLSSVTSQGTTQQIPLDPAVLPPLPNGVTSTGLTFDLATTAAYSGNPQVCLNVPGVALPVSYLRIYHLESGSWVDRTQSGGSLSSLCATGLTSLSPFAVGLLGPSAAGAAVSGRVTTADGRGIANAMMTLTDSHGVTRIARTGAFGYYRFEDLSAGENYILAVSTKRFSFAEPSRVVSVSDDVTEVDFVSE